MSDRDIYLLSRYHYPEIDDAVIQALLRLTDSHELYDEAEHWTKKCGTYDRFEIYTYSGIDDTLFVIIAMNQGDAKGILFETSGLDIFSYQYGEKLDKHI